MQIAELLLDISTQHSFVQLKSISSKTNCDEHLNKTQIKKLRLFSQEEIMYFSDTTVTRESRNGLPSGPPIQQSTSAQSDLSSLSASTNSHSDCCARHEWANLEPILTSPKVAATAQKYTISKC